MVWLNVLNNLEPEIKHAKSRLVFLAAALSTFCRMCEQPRPLESLQHATQTDHSCAEWAQSIHKGNSIHSTTL